MSIVEIHSDFKGVIDRFPGLKGNLESAIDSLVDYLQSVVELRNDEISEIKPEDMKLLVFADGFADSSGPYLLGAPANCICRVMARLFLLAAYNEEAGEALENAIFDAEDPFSEI